MHAVVLLSGLIALTVAVPAKDKLIKKNIAGSVSVPVLPDNRVIGGIAGAVPNTGVWGADWSRWGPGGQWRFNDRRAGTFVDPVTGEITSRIAGFGNQAGDTTEFGLRGFHGPSLLTRPDGSVERPINPIAPVNPIVPVNPIIRPIQPVIDPTYPKGGVLSDVVVSGSGRVVDAGLLDPVLDSGFAGLGVDRRFSGPLRRRISRGEILSRQDRRQDLLEREAESRRAAIRATRRRSGGKRYY